MTKNNSLKEGKRDTSITQNQHNQILPFSFLVLRKPKFKQPTKVQNEHSLELIITFTALKVNKVEQ